MNQHLESHQFPINQVYQIRRKILQDINSNWTESRNSKLGEISFSVVWFRLVHFSVQVPTWWWYKSSRGLIGIKVLCIHCCACGAVTVNLFVVLTTPELAPNGTYRLLCRVKFQQESSIGNNILLAFLPAISPMRVEILD